MTIHCSRRKNDDGRRTMIARAVMILVAIQALEVVHSTVLRDDIQWFTPNSNVKLPKPMSDNTANYIQGDLGHENGYIILTGGCDDPLGNQRDPDVDLFLFYCTSITNSTYKFNPFDETVTTLASAPHPRYRHAASVVKTANGKPHLFLLGGRDAEDNLVTAIDMYDIENDTWYTIGNLPDVIATSDLSSWTWQDKYIYISGGFVADYTASAKLYRFDMSSVTTDTTDALAGFPNSPGVLDAKQMKSANVARGDYHAIATLEDGYAYIAGGITHANNWCTSLRDTERYKMSTDTWETLSDLNVGRADMALATLGGKIIAAGGEVKPDDCETLLDPAYGSLPQDDVEVLIPSSNAGGDTIQWIPYYNHPLERFRFAAASVPALQQMYTFGGQKPFDEDCQCYAASDEISIAREVYDASEDVTSDGVAQSSGTSSSDAAAASGSGLSGGGVAGIAIACSVVCLVLGVVLGKHLGSGNSGSTPTSTTRDASQVPVGADDMASEDQVM